MPLNMTPIPFHTEISSILHLTHSPANHWGLVAQSIKLFNDSLSQSCNVTWRGSEHFALEITPKKKVTTSQIRRLQWPHSSDVDKIRTSSPMSGNGVMNPSYKIREEISFEGFSAGEISILPESVNKMQCSKTAHIWFRVQ